MINYQIEKFKNGLTLITCPMHETQAVTLLIAVKVGSRYEEKERSGISHFLEHLFFKGTKKRPSKLLIAKELDSLGANYNAMTSEEATLFYIQSAKEKFPTILEILSDMLLNPLIPGQEIEIEKGVITEELKMYRDDPMLHVQDLGKELTFGDTPLGRNIAGNFQTVRGMTRGAIENFRATFYQPSSMLVAVVGNPSKFSWKKEVRVFFEKLKAQKSPSYPVLQDAQYEPRLLVEKRKTDQAHLVFNLKTFPKTDQRRFALYLIQKILGGYMSSRLFLKIREEKGLAYYVRAGLDSFHDTGVLQAQAGLKTRGLLEALQIIFQELRDLKEGKIEEEELSRAKENLRGELSLELEDSFKVAAYLADDYFYFGKIFQPEELIEKVFAVNKKTIQKVAEEVVQPPKIALTILGPYDKNKTEEALHKLFRQNF